MKRSKCLILGVFVSLAFGSAIAKDLCNTIPGHWQGIYTIKQTELCEAYNGCTHLVSAVITEQSGNNYRLELNPAVGEGGSFDLRCENGKVTFSDAADSSMTVTCNAINSCYVVYNDSRLTSEMRRS